MKKILAILISLLMVALVGCSGEKEPNYKSSNNIVVSVNNMGIKGEKPFISVSLENKSDQKAVTYKNDFNVFEGDKKLKSKKKSVDDDVEYTLKPMESNSIVLYLDGYKLKENKTYRLAKYYSVVGSKETSVGYIDFEIDNSKIKGNTLTVNKTIWNAQHNNDNSIRGIKTFFLGKDNTLYKSNYNGEEYIIKEWYEICKFKEFKISKNDFKGMDNGEWYDGYSLNKLLSETEKAYKHISDDNGNFEYLLKMENGKYCYVDGWAGASGVYKIVEMKVK